MLLIVLLLAHLLLEELVLAADLQALLHVAAALWGSAALVGALDALDDKLAGC